MSRGKGGFDSIVAPRWSRSEFCNRIRHIAELGNAEVGLGTESRTGARRRLTSLPSQQPTFDLTRYIIADVRIQPAPDLPCCLALRQQHLGFAQRPEDLPRHIAFFGSSSSPSRRFGIGQTIQVDPDHFFQVGQTQATTRQQTRRSLWLAPVQHLAKRDIRKSVV